MNSGSKRRGDLLARAGGVDNFSSMLSMKIVHQYEVSESAHRLGRPPLPGEPAVYEILADIYEILAPGYGIRQNLRMSNVGFYVLDRVASLQDKLADQITLAYRTITADGGTLRRGLRAKAKRVTRTILNELPTHIERFGEDAECAVMRDPSSEGLEDVVRSFPGLKALWMHRFAHELYLNEVPIIPRMIAEFAHSKTGIDIHPGASIGRYFFIDHGTGVVIGQTARIGDYVTFYQGVTAGAISLPRDEDGRVHRDGKQRHPTFEDHVTVYANATILGGNTVIGSRAVIGASTWITRSIAPGMTVTLDNPRQRYYGALENNSDTYPLADDYQI